jgi:hypothetical protein
MRALRRSGCRGNRWGRTLSLQAAKVAFFELARRDSPPDLDRARRMADACYDSADYAEGRAARRDKRPPRSPGSDRTPRCPPSANTSRGRLGGGHRRNGAPSFAKRRAAHISQAPPPRTVLHRG